MRIRPNNHNNLARFIELVLLPISVILAFFAYFIVRYLIEIPAENLLEAIQNTNYLSLEPINSPTYWIIGFLLTCSYIYGNTGSRGRFQREYKEELRRNYYDKIEQEEEQRTHRG